MNIHMMEFPAGKGTEVQVSNALYPDTEGGQFVQLQIVEKDAASGHERVAGWARLQEEDAVELWVHLGQVVGREAILRRALALVEELRGPDLAVLPLARFLAGEKETRS